MLVTDGLDGLLGCTSNSTPSAGSIERTFAWLETFRRLLARHERLLSVYHGFMLLAFVLICLARISE